MSSVLIDIENSKPINAKKLVKNNKKDTMADVGIMAGIVWRYLKSNGCMVKVSDMPSLLQSKTNESDVDFDFIGSSSFSPALVNFAIGWLAREGKVVFSNERKAITVGIIEEKF